MGIITTETNVTPYIYNYKIFSNYTQIQILKYEFLFLSLSVLNVSVQLKK